MEHLFRVSLSVSLLGIFLLLLLANIIEPKLIQISSISKENIDQRVKISGTITRIQDKETFQILTIKDNSSQIDILCNCDLTNIKDIEVIGKVQEYKKSLQLNAEKIKELKADKPRRT